jgi:hypothetical protein
LSFTYVLHYANTGRKVKKYNPKKYKYLKNVEEFGTYYQGDILHPPGLGRQAIIGDSYRWPNKTVPYVISGKFSKYRMETNK